MLSYRHAFHAGNHADVLKHCILLEVLAHLGQKDKAYWVLDTHAGAGLYDLSGAYATRLAEYENGIGRLWQRTDLPPPVANYVQSVRGLNPDGRLRHYPGSPWLALSMLRSQDRLRLFEMHSTECRLLRQNFSRPDRRLHIEAGDGFSALPALLPPPPRRGLVLIDPAYEDKRDYLRVVAALEEGLARFASGIFMLWYPLLQRREAQALPGKLRRLPAKRWLQATLQVSDAGKADFGMTGSGIFIVNPPWQLAATLRACLPFLAAALGQDAAAGYSLEEETE